ncbi:reverse transcriptase [Plakobranchus ocellatus]|uniref:Reverse transcriptase n=1 Tax=Plakobranchus ocellatus TaxID=259542 RepID=A0AAV3YBT6_9GAST|nr:reverse transcriptase [Plakobranchus ocellatus]
MRLSTNSYTTNWINLEVGIAKGCTISSILFVMAMEVILKAAEGSAGPANLGGGCSMPPLKAFMDDTTIICSKEDETRRKLTRLDDLMSWCRMEFKPKKSRSLSKRRGKVDEATTFTVVEQQIPKVSQELASESLLAINKCGLQGKFKIWCLQFMLTPKLLWPLLVYDICSSAVEAIEAKINKYTRKWLGVPPGLSDVAMYCRKAKLKLPMKSILEEYKCGKARLLTMLEESDDPVVKTVQPSLKTGRKWKVTKAVDEAKECLKMKEVIGQTQTDRRGLGSTTVKWRSKTEGKEKRDMIIDEIRNKEDSTRAIVPTLHLTSALQVVMRPSGFDKIPRKSDLASYNNLRVNGILVPWLNDQDDLTCNSGYNQDRLLIDVEPFIMSWFRVAAQSLIDSNETKISVRHSHGTVECSFNSSYIVDDKTRDFYCPIRYPVRQIEFVGQKSVLASFCGLYFSLASAILDSPLRRCSTPEQLYLRKAQESNGGRQKHSGAGQHFRVCLAAAGLTLSMRKRL